MTRIDNLADAAAEIRELKRQVRILSTAAPLSSSSIGRGGLRVYDGGVILIENGGLRVIGWADILGALNGEGDLNWTGSAYFDGPVEITDTLKVLALTTLMSELVVDGGKITSGNVRIEDGKIYVGLGANQIVIDGATGRITAGKLTIDPTISGGAVTFENGAQVFTDADTIQLFKGNSVAQVSDDYARIQHGGSVVEIDVDGIRMSPGAVATESSAEDHYWMMIHPTTGRVKKINPTFGGPGGGRFDWPFPESTITSRFRTTERPTHDGLDFAYPGIGGTPIPAAGQGVVAAAGWSSGYGWYVDLDHMPIGGATIMTRYGHMQTAPVVSTGDTVIKGQTLGPVGDTGMSEGDHLHWETWVDGEPMDPEIFMTTYGA